MYIYTDRYMYSIATSYAIYAFRKLYPQSNPIITKRLGRNIVLKNLLTKYKSCSKAINIHNPTK